MSKTTQKRARGPPRGPKGRDTEILVELEQLNLPSFYVGKTVKHNTEHYCLDSSHLKKQIRAQVEYKNSAFEAFNILPRRRNLLSFLYHLDEKFDLARDENDVILTEHPQNINGLTIKVHLCLNKKDIAGAKKALETLKNLEGENREREILIAKAEKAFFYAHLIPKVYLKAVELYEEVLGMDPGATSLPPDGQSRLDQLCDVKHRLIYPLELATTYNKIMNQDNLPFSQKEDDATCQRDHKSCFDCIFNLLRSVIDRAMDPEINEGIQKPPYIMMACGQAWVELGSAYKKYEIKIPTKDQRQDILQGMTVDECYEKAEETCPDDPHVLEKYGIHLRHRATNEEDFKNAIVAFDTVLDKCPTRHIALHHKALAYQEAWYDAEGLDKAKLKRNESRTPEGMTQRNRRGRDAYMMSSPNIRDSANRSLVHDRQNPSVISDRQSPQGHQRGRWTGSQRPPYSGRGRGRAKPLQTFYPKQTSGQLPRHNEPGYFDKLRVQNPRVPNKDAPHEYLVNAKRCLQQAVEITEGTATRYLIDLGRLHICLQEYDEARQCFEKARKETNHFNFSDGSYLYEQWALLDDETSLGDPTREDENIISLYRAAVEYSVAARIRSKMAYYKLRDLLTRKLQSEPPEEHATIKMELGILDKTIEQYDKAKRTFLDLLECDDSNVDLMWELVDTLQGKKDFKAAYTYVHTICIYLQSRNEMETLEAERLQQILDIGLQRVEVNPSDGENKQILATLFGLLVRKKDIPLKKLDEFGGTARDVLILASDSGTPTVTFLQYVLKKCCNLKTYLVTTSGEADNDPTLTIYEAVERAAEASNSTIIVTDDIDNDIELQRVIEALLTDKEQSKLAHCTLHTTGCETKNIPSLLKTLPNIECEAPEDVWEENAELNDDQVSTVSSFIQDVYEKILLKEEE